MYLPRASNPGKCSKACGTRWLQTRLPNAKSPSPHPRPAAQDGAKTLAAQITQTAVSGLTSDHVAGARCMIIHSSPVPERPVMPKIVRLRYA